MTCDRDKSVTREWGKMPPREILMRSAWKSSRCNKQPAGFYRNTEPGYNTLNGQV